MSTVDLSPSKEGKKGPLHQNDAGKKFLDAYSAKIYKRVTLGSKKTKKGERP